MNSPWRLIRHQEWDAATNMAIDEAVLQSHLDGMAPPTLRFYRFAPPAVSIGYGQKLKQEEEQSIRNAGLDLVRRPTGGRAVLHLDDLTYSFVGSSLAADVVASKIAQPAPSTLTDGDGIASGAGDKIAAHPGFLSCSVSVSYKEICRGLIEGLKTFGIELELGSTTADYRASYDCFVATTGADLHLAGKKLIGSAQMRRKYAVLQHGSILLNQDQEKMSSLFGDTKTAIRHANLYEILDRAVPLDELEAAIVKGFESVFMTSILPGELSAYEQNLVCELLPKYQTFA